jgi:hypothetical protein
VGFILPSCAFRKCDMPLWFFIFIRIFGGFTRKGLEGFSHAVGGAEAVAEPRKARSPP